ncbi:MAG: DUF6591 domain-containing protein [Coriobacteriales bacterium]|jgi:hypothetical protein
MYSADASKASSSSKSRIAGHPSQQKQAKNGYDEQRNQEIAVAGVTFSVPAYFELDESASQDNAGGIYTVADDDVELFTSQWEGSQTSDEAASSVGSAIETALEDTDDVNITDTGETEVAGIVAGTCTAIFTDSDGPASLRAVMFCNEDMGNAGWLVLVQHDSSKYDYSGDFDKVIASAEKDAAAAVSPDFKKTMDKYEKFFDKYVKVLKKYKKDPSDPSILGDYTDVMSEYSDMMESYDEIDTSGLSAGDLAYYNEVNARIPEKLSEVQ